MWTLESSSQSATPTIIPLCRFKRFSCWSAYPSVFLSKRKAKISKSIRIVSPSTSVPPRPRCSRSIVHDPRCAFRMGDSKQLVGQLLHPSHRRYCRWRESLTPPWPRLGSRASYLDPEMAGDKNVGFSSPVYPLPLPLPSPVPLGPRSAHRHRQTPTAPSPMRAA